MKRLVDVGRPSSTVLIRQGNIGRNLRTIADLRDAILSPYRSIAVDHQPGITLEDYRGIELFNQCATNSIDSDIPGNMPGQMPVIKAQIAEVLRYSPPGVLAGYHKGRCPIGIDDLDRIGIVGTQGKDRLMSAICHRRLTPFHARH